MFVMMACGGHKQWIDQLEEHIIAYREHGIEMLGIYLEIRVENPLEQDYLIEAIEIIERQNCKIAMYNHGGWTGLPSNQVKIVKKLRTLYNPEGVGIVLNFHHAHPFVDHFSELFAEAKPYLFLVKTNGMRLKMNDEGKKEGEPKILALGKVDHEVDMLRVVKESVYSGPVGVIDHMKQIDPEVNLRNNLNALKSILGQLDAEE
jgi:hypothetical protein